ncbi:MAG: alpha/beta hydrolase family protein [Rubripirellula sp.]
MTGLWVTLAVVGVLGVLGCGGILGAYFLGGGRFAGGPRFDADLNYEASPIAMFDDLPTLVEVEPGIEKAIAHAGVDAGPGSADLLYLYRPTESAEGSLPCVFVAAAGATAFSGMGIADGDEPELLPYARAGFVVVGYETDGELKGDQSILAVRHSFMRYRASQAGLVNARNAIDYALANLPEVDPDRLYTAGHSSAGSQALLLAAHDPRIKGCVAFNSVIDNEQWLGDDFRSLVGYLPNGGDDCLRMWSPKTHEESIHCPVLFFHSEADRNVDASQSKDAANRMKGMGKEVDLVVVPNGDHYNSMIVEGIPAAVEWLSTLAGITSSEAN